MIPKINDNLPLHMVDCLDQKFYIYIKKQTTFAHDDIIVVCKGVIFPSNKSLIAWDGNDAMHSGFLTNYKKQFKEQLKEGNEVLFEACYINGQWFLKDIDVFDRLKNIPKSVLETKWLKRSIIEWGFLEGLGLIDNKKLLDYSYFVRKTEKDILASYFEEIQEVSKKRIELIQEASTFSKCYLGFDIECFNSDDDMDDLIRYGDCLTTKNSPTKEKDAIVEKIETQIAYHYQFEEGECEE